MKNILPFVLTLVCACNSTKAQEEALTTEASLLFQNTHTTTLTNADKNNVFEASDLAVASNGTQFYLASNMDTAEFPFDVIVYPLDLNKDGIEEIALQYGNIMTSGNAGSSTMLLIKNDEDVYEMYLGFPGFLSFLPLGNLDFPDVVIGGPGFEFPVWRWDGTTYQIDRRITNEGLSQENAEFIAIASANYTTSLKKE